MSKNVAAATPGEEKRPVADTASEKRSEKTDPAAKVAKTPTRFGGTPTVQLYFKLALADGSTAEAPKIDTTLKEQTQAALNRASATSAPLISTDMNTAAEELVAVAGTLSESQWAVVLRNCGVFYGWIIDPLTRRIVRAPKAAFQLRSKVSQDPVASIPDLAAPIFAGQSTSHDTGATQEQSTRSEQFTMPTIKSVKTDQGIPNFRVNDDSKIEITACSHELQVSLAHNDFSSQSTEASVSGGFGGVTVGVSAGYSSEKSSTTSNSSDTKSTTMVARYMFPRCDIFLYPDDLEPTPDLAALLHTVATTKSIQALRKIHQDFGQLFCQNLTLGARLLTTKLMTDTATLSSSEQKEQFKVSVGVSVTTPFGGASVKHDETHGSSDTAEKAVKDTVESNVFEAVGGNTLLANNPVAWSSSVGSSDLWRVINVRLSSSFTFLTNIVVREMPCPRSSRCLLKCPAIHKSNRGSFRLFQR